jgi:type IV pilus assembly protein PilC
MSAMTTFRYRATKTGGGKVRGVTKAVSAKGAMATLLDQGLEVEELKERRSVLQLEITKEKLKLDDVMHFSRQLAAFVRAGVPLLEAIEVIEEEADDKTLKRVLTSVREELSTGETFSSALSPFASLFPQFYVDMIRAAELTGSLDEVLDEMSRYIERDLEARQKIKSALMYPTVIAVASVVTVVILSVFVLPRFKAFFESFDATLPLPTRMLIALTNFLSGWWWAMVAGLVAFIVLFVLAVRSRRGRKLWHRFLLWVPVIGHVIRFTILERFCRLLATMMDAGVPLPEAMAVLGKGTNNVLFEQGIANVREAMMQGEGLARPMTATKLFPSAVTQMVRVGENTGTLGAQLEVASVYYGRELEYKIKRLTSLFEPAVILLMGIVVGFVAIALISAMYGIYRQV